MRLYRKEVSYVEEPETPPQNDTEVTIVNSSDGKKVFKIKNDQGSSNMFHECFSTIYIQSIIQSLPYPDPALFKFSPLEMAGLYHQQSENGVFIISECASGHSIDRFAAIVKNQENDKLFLWIISRTAKAFAQLHQSTKRELGREAALNAIARSYNTTLEGITNSLIDDPQIDDPSVIITRDSLSKINDFCRNIIKEDEHPDTAYLRNIALVHGDPHVGNIFYDGETDSVTFIDYETAIRSFRRDADSLKDLGCFLESVWLTLAGIQERAPQQLYELALLTRRTLISCYMECEDELALQRVKLYMWCQLFDFISSPGIRSEYADRIKCIQYFLSCEFG